LEQTFSAPGHHPAGGGTACPRGRTVNAPQIPFDRPISIEPDVQGVGDAIVCTHSSPVSKVVVHGLPKEREARTGDRLLELQVKAQEKAVSAS
jgi:hypothetical protein